MGSCNSYSRNAQKTAALVDFIGHVLILFTEHLGVGFGRMGRRVPCGLPATPLSFQVL
jgi:hypothetical protein